MFNLFKKSTQKSTLETRGTVQSSQPYYMSAKQALRLSIKHWPILPIETIFETIEARARDGYQYAVFNGAHLNGLQLTKLKELGYTVEINTSKDSVPYYKVSW